MITPIPTATTTTPVGSGLHGESCGGPRPAVTELRLSAFKSHRGTQVALGPVTVVCGRSGTGKSSLLEALAVLARLASGEDVGTAIESAVRGGSAACVPDGARPDAQGRRGLRIGCTVDGPVGPVRLDLAIQAEPRLCVVGERLTGSGETLLSTALRDPARRTVQAAWHTGGLTPVTRAPLPDDRLATALLPLRVAGRTDGQRLVLAAAEQVLLALRAIFPVDPQPRLMRGPARTGDGRLRGTCDNLSAVLHRTRDECRTRHAALVEAARMACQGPVAGVTTIRRTVREPGGGASRETVLAALERGGGSDGCAGALGMTPVDRLGDGELRFLALALVLLTGPGVLAMDHSQEVLPARQAMTVLADGLDAGLDAVQTRQVLRLAVRASRRGHVRLLGAAQDAGRAEDALATAAADVDGAGAVEVVRLDGRPGPHSNE